MQTIENTKGLRKIPLLKYRKIAFRNSLIKALSTSNDESIKGSVNSIYDAYDAFFRKYQEEQNHKNFLGVPLNLDEPRAEKTVQSWFNKKTDKYMGSDSIQHLLILFPEAGGVVGAEASKH